MYTCLISVCMRGVRFGKTGWLAGVSDTSFAPFPFVFVYLLLSTPFRCSSRDERKTWRGAELMARTRKDTEKVGYIMAALSRQSGRMDLWLRGDIYRYLVLLAGRLSPGSVSTRVSSLQDYRGGARSEASWPTLGFSFFSYTK